MIHWHNSVAISTSTCLGLIRARTQISQTIHFTEHSPSLSIRTKGVATAVSAVSMIRVPKATWVTTSVTTVQLTGFSYLKSARRGILMQDHLRTSNARATNIIATFLKEQISGLFPVCVKHEQVIHFQFFIHFHKPSLRNGIRLT
ncbi:hypothetical protein TNCV_2471071 [Trichonephila clavipes]|nr:hypothetical protein TNCV_2471071 [Trichonephila clavipes]